ncbi:AbrB/MazE/SpoVT family DNA-binding domain-containing protein [Terrilactibacillus sp. BCM23-1]|uniref:AbrB/MazE/SpoVT family DNA-binding domain-containing protein n=1 Tax=Terrilactibacillus tamarindi TaxID=2599694 RepID=A0A6N8CRF4_9BACI|nr:AbrB/MazE/SpoVT family DNA-binding domain-containing protein [Terrilactibacillus tamarindi]MTT32218.1 AbrB/MazE/SpoVT family DNA-binding domain-containing protein [Terrilactibacillus tamarindi]
MKERLSIRKRGQVTLPKSIMEQFKLEEGDTLELSINGNGEITVVPMVQIPANQRWFWSDEWQKEEREAEEDIKAGRVKSFDNIDEAINWLDSDEAEEWSDGKKQ